MGLGQVHSSTVLYCVLDNITAGLEPLSKSKQLTDIYQQQSVPTAIHEVGTVYLLGRPIVISDVYPIFSNIEHWYRVPDIFAFSN